MKEIELEKEMCTLLEKKLDKFKEYRSITEKMKQIVCGYTENIELSGLINRKQKCINAIEKINASMEKMVKNSSVKLSRISKKYKGLVEGHLSDIKEIMLQVDIVDKDLVTIVAEQREDIKTKLLKMRNMQQAARGYKANTRHPAKFLDTRR